MNEKDRQDYLERYKKAKEKGIWFFPNALFKDAVVSLIILLVLIALAYFVGAPLEERANPSDSNYTPRPEWYFLFLFQLLKYFPGEIEFIGVVVLPTVAVLLLLALPFLDKSPARDFRKRPWVTVMTGLGIVAVIVLTILSVVEAPPPAEAALGDQTAVLYTENCAGCHGESINVPEGMNLHEVIAQGSHADMPPWSADLTNDEIDALAGFILSPAGSSLFTAYCSECHETPDMVTGNPLSLKQVMDEGINSAIHSDVEIPHWPDVMAADGRTALLNFLIAPDGQRLFSTNCSSCHGYSVAFSGTDEELRATILEGGLHLEMPSWQGRLSPDQLDSLAKYVVDPGNNPDAATLYESNCVDCHYNRIPTSESYEVALDVISTGGSHETMPVWGEVLTDEQIDALVGYTRESASGTSLEAGRILYVKNCASCHGDFGEGGPNPSKQGDIIAPISTAEYLSTRDDLTLRAIISQGQPNFGMSPFGLSFGGPLDTGEVDVMVKYLRSWQADPPVDLPPQVEYSAVALTGSEIYQSICSQCHGVSATGGVGPSLRSSTFRWRNTQQDIFNAISEGHQATTMIAWGEILSSGQIHDIVTFIIDLPVSNEGAAAGEISFAASIKPIFEKYCTICHDEESAEGGYIATNYADLINSGDSGPAVIPGDADTSLLAIKLLGLQEEGDIMPPKRVMPEESIQLILDWIKAGAPNN